MKQQLKLNVTPRAQTGRSSSRRMRKANQVPAILYGKHTPPETLAIDGPEFTRLIKTIAGSAALVELERKDKPEKALSFLRRSSATRSRTSTSMSISVRSRPTRSSRSASSSTSPVSPSA